MAGFFEDQDREDKRAYKKMVVYFVTAASLVMLLFLTVIYFNTREKQERKRALEKEKQEQMQEALCRIGCPALKPEDAEDLRKLYRKLVRRLHPDVNPDGTENDLKLFQQAVEAYRNGDLSAMRILSVLADTGGKALQNDSLAVLEAERERLNACLETVRARAEKVRNSFPYVLRDMLEDPAGIEEYRHSLKIRIEQYDAAIRELQTTVDEFHRRMLS